MEEPLRWSDSTHQRVRGSSPEHAARLFPRRIAVLPVQAKHAQRKYRMPAHTYTTHLHTQKYLTMALQHKGTCTHTHTFLLPSSTLTGMYCTICAYMWASSHFCPPHTLSSHISIFASTCFSTAIAPSLHVLANPINHPRNTPLSSGMSVLCRACCGLQVFSCTSYCSGEGLCPGTLPIQSKKEEEEEEEGEEKHYSPFPWRVVCKLLLCCASFMPW